MASDVMEYRKAPAEASRGTLYRYQAIGEEVRVALDFGEGIALTASETECPEGLRPAPARK